MFDKPENVVYNDYSKREEDTEMDNWIVVEVKDNGEKRALNGEYATWEEACEVQEAMEWLHDENNYLIYTLDEWVYEGENAV